MERKTKIAETVKNLTDSAALLYSYASVPNIKSRKDLVKYFRSLGLKSGAEIGVYKGDFAKVILEEIPGLVYYGIDTWNDKRIFEEAKNKVACYNAKLIKIQV